MVERFDGGYFEDGPTFGGGFFRRRLSLVGCGSILGILGSEIHN